MKIFKVFSKIFNVFAFIVVVVVVVVVNMVGMAIHYTGVDREATIYIEKIKKLFVPRKLKRNFQNAILSLPK